MEFVKYGFVQAVFLYNYNIVCYISVW